ncbi:helix-turn-helix transcriptional regulator [Arthrobacter sp. CDRTa11]|uniref:helix-turn-helix domain-containing protein n=1 Tax=Arthrobacter sp. CDRTa11 TaxID=2651199 RepID=UPI0022659082|nr:AraC family transcriptional regulator [Arthrobacter sp. CDRTa11]UZX01449.1 helix-turn-helix transcriptional regulator [Arthrobacter sp. CDRTa11]
MLYEEFPAPARLQPYVSHFWFVRGAPPARYEKILPGPLAHLILNLSSPYRLLDPFAAAPGSGAMEVAVGFYSGVQRSYLISENPPQLFNIGAALRPYGIAALTDVPPSELQGKVQDTDVFLPGFASLRTGLMDSGPAPAFAALETFLTSRFGGGADPRTLEAVALLAEEDIPVAELARRLGLSPSTLQRIMLRDCGITPKSYADVCRFYRFVNAAARLPEDGSSGRELLALADYYDQPHLIRAFRRFSGFTPSEYLRLVREHGPEYATFIPLRSVG